MRRALVIGINYIGTDNELRGCHNDVDNICAVLDGYECKVMKDLPQNVGTSLMPTRDNIIAAIREVVDVTAPGDTLYIHYSGHGSYCRDRNGDEKDGRDETICALDADIVDDELYDLIVRPIPSKARVRVVFDCCHSGSALDLPCRYGPSGKFYAENNQVSDRDVIMLSGCMDPQTSADAKIRGKFQGALTAGILRCNREVSWKVFMKNLRGYLEPYEQCPQLSFCNRNHLNDQVDLFK